MKTETNHRNNTAGQWPLTELDPELSRQESPITTTASTSIGRRALIAAAAVLGAAGLALAAVPAAGAGTGYYATGPMQCNGGVYIAGEPTNVNSIAVYPPSMSPTDPYTTPQSPQTVAWIPGLFKWAPDQYGRFDWRLVRYAPTWLLNSTAFGYVPAHYGNWRRADTNASVGFWTFGSLGPGTYQVRNFGHWYATSRVPATGTVAMGLSLSFDLLDSCGV